MKLEAVNIQTIAGEQSIRIPEVLRIDDSRVYLKKSGNALIILPFHSPWQSLYQSLEQFSPDFMDDRLQPPTQNREAFDDGMDA